MERVSREHERVTVTVHGKPAAVLISFDGHGITSNAANDALRDTNQVTIDPD